VPEEVRRGIDRAITSWNAAPQNDKPNIAPEIRKAARDGFPYLCLLIEKRMTMVPVNVLCAELGTIGDIRAIPALRAVLGTESARDREAAVTALLKIGKPECLNPLIEALNDPADTVWRPISELLVRKFNRGELPNLPSILESSLEKAESRQGYVITLGNMVGSQAHDTLLNLLRNGGDTERREALQGLSARPSAEDAELVLPLLGRGERSLRQEACLYLGKTKHQPAVPDLIRLLEREEGGIAANAHWALREITGEKMDANPEAWRQWYERSDLKKKLEP
jgi:HEAT repeat protein